MITLKDGPVAGSYTTQRAPKWLRAVIDANGKRDVLDLLEDAPKPSEAIHVYRRRGEAGFAFYCMRGSKGSSKSATGEYEHLADMDGETVRSPSEWRAWCAIEHFTEMRP